MSATGASWKKVSDGLVRAGNKVSDRPNLEEISDGRYLKKKPATDFCELPKKVSDRHILGKISDGRKLGKNQPCPQPEKEVSEVLVLHGKKEATDGLVLAIKSATGTTWIKSAAGATWKKKSATDSCQPAKKSATCATRGKISDRPTAQPENEVSNGLLWSGKKISDMRKLGKSQPWPQSEKEVSDGLVRAGKKSFQAEPGKVSDGRNLGKTQRCLQPKKVSDGLVRPGKKNLRLA